MDFERFETGKALQRYNEESPMTKSKNLPERLVVAANQNLNEKYYWLEKLSGELTKSSFPYDKRKKGGNKHKMEAVKFKLSEDICSRLIAYSNKQDEALHMILLTAVVLLIHKYKYTYMDEENNDIIVGIPIYKDDSDGDFINTVLAIRNQVADDLTFKESLLQIRQAVIEADENLNYPIEVLVTQLGLPFDPGDDFPLFDIVVLLENIHDRKYIRHIVHNTTFCFLRTDAFIEGVLEYNSLLYKKVTIERIVNHFIRLIREAISDLDLSISNIPILSEKEKRKLLNEFNDSKIEYPMYKPIDKLFEEQVERTPDNISVVDEDRKLTYREVNNKSNQLARFLKGKGVGADCIVGLMVQRSIDMVIGIIGILKAGGAYLPIEPETPVVRIISMLDDCQTPLLLSTSDIIEKYSFTAFQKLHSLQAKIHLTEVRSQITDLDFLPIPDRSLVDYEKYNQFLGQAMVKNFVSLMGTRGCPYYCAYCHKIWPKRHVIRSAENIFAEVKLYYDTGVRRFAFIDDIFNLDRKNSMRFFNLIIENGLDVQLFFPNGMRADILTKDYIDLMVKAGTISVAFAIETASPRLQKLIGKNLNLEKCRENIEYMVKKYPHVILELFTMHGFPSETKEEALMTLDFIKSVKWLHFPYVSILRIYPSTDMAKLAIENGISEEAIFRSEDLAFHELPETLVFDKSFTLKYQADFLNEYFLSKERLLHVLPYQMKVLTEDEIVQKYNRYLPVEIYSFDQLLDFVGIARDELGLEKYVDETKYVVPHLYEKMKMIFPKKTPSRDALRILLLDLSQFFSGESNMLYDVVEPPLGIMYILSYLNQQFGSKINGRIVKSRIDFDNYSELKALLYGFKPDVIGVRTLTFYRDFFHKTISIIRQWGIDVPIITGGPYAISSYETILQDRNLDLVVLGEGEVTFCHLIAKILENNKKLPSDDTLREIPGVAFIPGKREQQRKLAREIIIMDKLTELLSKESCEDPKNITRSSNLLYVMCTSGSTGRPKGVMVEHRQVVRLVKSTNYIKFRGGERILQTGALDFDASTFEIWGALLNGLGLYLTGKDAVLSPQLLKEIIQKYRIDIMWLTSPLFNQMVEADIEIFRGLRYLLVGGDVLSPPHINRVKSRYPWLRIVNGYGPTENTTFSTTYEICSECDGSIPIGAPITNSTAYILDKNYRLVPIGVYGELVVGGDGVARGYLNKPELTAEKFIANPYLSSTANDQLPMTHRMYRTGDLARWLPDGNIEFSGRRDFQVKIRGFRVELGEIESQLLSHEKTKKSAVVVMAKEDKKGDKYLCAYIAPVSIEKFAGDTTEEIDVSELRKFLSKHLPEYMIPAFFIPLEKMPLTPSGKVDRKALPDPIIGTKEKYIAPRNEAEEILANVWAGVLGVERVGINDDFFEIGGDSIKSIQIGARLYKAGYKVEIRNIFINPTISELAPKIKKIERIAEQSPITGIVPLSPIQRWFFDNKFIDSHHFNQAVMLYAKEGIDEAAVKALFVKIQEHHDAFRMTFQRKTENEKEEIVQINQSLEHPFSLEVYDLRNRENAVKMLDSKVNEIQASIDLEKGPLMKLGLFHLDDGDRLLIVIHHLVIDAVSWRILFEDIETLYQQYKNDRQLELPLKTDSFKLWSEKLSEFANSEAFLKEKTFWKEIESKGIEIPVILKDFEEESNFIKDSTTLAFTLSEEETESLITKVNEPFGTEINDILLTALGLGVKKTFGHTQLLIALEGHGREEILKGVDINRTLGWFTTMYPLLLDFSYAYKKDLSRQIKEVKEALRRVPNKGIGYGILKYLTCEEHKKDIVLKLNPQISFNYLGQFDTDVEQISFAIAKESVGNYQSKEGEREFDIDVSGITANKRLSISINFNKKHFKSETFKTLLDNIKVKLIEIISFCSNRKRKELTPSDLTYKNLPIETLDRLQIQYPIKDIYGLTPIQEGMLFHMLKDPSSSANFQQISYRLVGKLDITTVEKTLNELLKRHDILRTVFIYKGVERPLQLVLKDRQTDFCYEDLREMDSDDRERFIDEFKKNSIRRSFDLRKDVLIRVAVLQVRQSEYEFIWSYHHILLDGWCLGILFSEYLEIYNSFLANRPYQLPEVQPYLTYIEWLEKQDLEASKRYWKKYLEDFEEVSTLPKNKGLKGRWEKGYQLEEVSFLLEREATQRLKKLAGRNQVTLNTVIQTVWGIILGKYNKTWDVVFGAVVSGRPSEIEGIESMIGIFINTIPVRIKYEDKISFKDLLKRIQTRAVESEPHHYFSLAAIQSESELKQNLLEHVIVFENYPIEEQIEWEMSETEERDRGVRFEVSKVDVFSRGSYDFCVLVMPGESLKISLMYNSCLYERELIKRVSNDFKNVIHQILENEAQDIDEITLFSESETSETKMPSRIQKAQEDLAAEFDI